MKVAIVKLSSIGDVVHALPVAIALKRRWPAVHVTWVAEAREATLLRGHAAIDEVIVADTRGWRRSRPRRRGLREALRVARALRSGGFDVALDLQGLLKSGVLAAMTRGRRRIGFASEFRREWLAGLFVRERVRPSTMARHVVDQYLSLLRPLGIADLAVEFNLPTDVAADVRAEEFLADHGIKPRDRLVLINPGAARVDKRWPAESFRAVARRIGEESGVRAVVVWGPGEETDARAIVAGATGAFLAPPTTLRDLVALSRRAALMIAGDTGPLHIAAALGVPCVGLYGPTSGVRNGPYGRGHRVLQSQDGRIASISVTSVLDAASRALEDAA
jgi:lipopolysaccharide heptosyltransferase I